MIVVKYKIILDIFKFLQSSFQHGICLGDFFLFSFLLILSDKLLYILVQDFVFRWNV